MSQSLTRFSKALSMSYAAPRQRKLFRWAIYLYILPALLFMLTFVYYPITYTIGVSTLDWNGIGAQRTPIGLENYQSIFVDPIVRRALGNQVGFGLIPIFTGRALGHPIAIR